MSEISKTRAFGIANEVVFGRGGGGAIVVIQSDGGQGTGHVGDEHITGGSSM